MIQGVEHDELRALVERARSYETDAWEELYRNVRPALFGYALRRLRSTDAAEDAVSETMTRALEKIGRYRWQAPGFEAWLVGILRNVVYETWRATRRDARVLELPVPVPIPDVGPADRVLHDEEARAVRDAFGALDADEQEMLELRVVHGLSADDVGAIQGRAAGAVRMAQHRALGRLRTIMGAIQDG